MSEHDNELGAILDRRRNGARKPQYTRIASFYNICLYRYMSHSSGIVYVCKRGTEISISYAVAHIFEVLFRECVHSRRPGANPVPGLWLGNTISIRTSI